MDFVVSTCILHFIVQVKCKNSEALTITTQSDTHYTQLERSVQSGGGGGGAPAPGAPLLPTPLSHKQSTEHSINEPCGMRCASIPAADR